MFTESAADAGMHRCHASAVIYMPSAELCADAFAAVSQYHKQVDQKQVVVISGACCFTRNIVVACLA